MKVLVIEDEPDIIHLLDRGLTPHGHQLASANSGEDGALLAAVEPFDLVILDISLPGIDGHETLARIRRKRPETVVLMLTGRDDLEDKVSALDAGADDYLTKPFDFEELLARMRALTRRADQRKASQLEAGDLRVDLLSHRVWRGDHQIDLSSREFALLEYFMRHPRQLLSRQQILSSIWEYDFDPESNVVDVYVGYVRRKINRPEEQSLISTVRNAGYRFDPPAGE